LLVVTLSLILSGGEEVPYHFGDALFQSAFSVSRVE
jgi:hypothetical protein